MTSDNHAPVEVEIGEVTVTSRNGQPEVTVEIGEVTIAVSNVTVEIGEVTVIRSDPDGEVVPFLGGMECSDFIFSG